MWHLLSHVPVRTHHFSVVGRVSHNCVVCHAVLVEGLEQPRELLVDRRYCPLIALLGTSQRVKRLQLRIGLDNLVGWG